VNDSASAVAVFVGTWETATMAFKEYKPLAGAESVGCCHHPISDAADQGNPRP